MSNLPDAHPDTGEPTRIVVGFIAPMAADTMRIGGRAAAYGTGRATVDLANAKDIAGRRCGPAAEAEIGKALLRLAPEHPNDLAALAQSMGEILCIAEGVASGKPSALAVRVANRILTPENVLSSRGADQMDLVVLAYATLQLDQERVLDGGIS